MFKEAGAAPPITEGSQGGSCQAEGGRGQKVLAETNAMDLILWATLNFWSMTLLVKYFIIMGPLERSDTGARYLDTGGAA